MSSSEAMAMTEKLERAISVRQPYVEMILRGVKGAEYRSRPTRVRGRVYLYASKSLGNVEAGVKAGVTLDAVEGLPRGAIVGSVEVIGCDWDARRECYAWKLARPVRYPQALPFRGQPQPAFWCPVVA